MLAALFSLGSATAAVQGSGTSSAGTTLLQLDLTDLLTAKVIGDTSRSSIDKAVGTPEAATVLHPLTLSSPVPALAALNKDVAPTEVRTQSDQKTADYSADLGAVGGLPQIVDGTLTPASLAAVVDTVGARSGMLDNLADLTIAGGLATVDSVAADLGTSATKDASNGARTLAVGTVSGLNLGALLGGLGIPVDALSLPTIESLIGQLGLLGSGNPVADLMSTLGLGGSAPTNVAGLNTLVTTLQAALTTATTNLASLNTAFPGVACTNLVTLTNPLASTIGVPVGTTCTAALATLTSNQTAAAGDVGGLLDGLLQLVDRTDLLTLDGINAGVTTKATDTVGTSVAKSVASIGAISVANLASVPGVDLTSTAAQVTAAVGSVTGQLDGILGTVSPDLAGLITVKLLDTSGTGVTKTATGYVQSVANLTALDLGIKPPATLGAIVAGLPATNIGDVLAGIPGFATLPALPGLASIDAVSTLLSAGTPVDALVKGARLRIASVNGVADFLPAAAAAAPPSNTLPRTGGSTAGFAVAGTLMAMLGFGLRRRVLAPVRVE
ncbi:MAG: hypothetical protein QOJ09_1545 [Actinomycetota bacterium]|nr:hypothetical protein [Actinomycetota bacterium]